MNLSNTQEIQICKKCGSKIKDAKIIWDEKGLGYSTKLCQCSECKTLNIIEYYEDCSLDINKDTRYYEYK